MQVPNSGISAKKSQNLRSILNLIQDASALADTPLKNGCLHIGIRCKEAEFPPRYPTLKLVFH
jgi:hypothetical protein